MEFSEYHLGQLKAKIAKLRTQLLEPPKACFFFFFFDNKLLDIYKNIYMYVADSLPVI